MNHSAFRVLSFILKCILRASNVEPDTRTVRACFREKHQDICRDSYVGPGETVTYASKMDEEKTSL